MGEARRRSGEIKQLKERVHKWRESLTVDEKEIALIAERLFQRFVAPRGYFAGCYHLAFFLTQFLENKGILVNPVVGWVNDGTWDGVTSHAWIEFNGKKTDISLAFTEHPHAQPSGSVIILDFEVMKGVASYSYYPDQHPVPQEALARLRTRQDLDLIRDKKDAEHQRMLAIATTRTMMKHLDSAPRGLRYEDLARAIHQ